jgi:agmatinase
LDTLPLFIVPEKTKAGYSFADTPIKISFKESHVVFYGVPLDITTSFGKGTSRGPEAIRLTSARQIETFMLDEKGDIYEFNSIFDLGDLKLPNGKKSPDKILAFLDSTIPKVVKEIRTDNKIPVMIGGEHTLSYYQIKAIADEEPIVIHFDAHRDMKPEYEGMKMCHTTPFYHLFEYISAENLIQIGIRQTDKEENEIAAKNGVITFDAWHVHEDIASVLDYLQNITEGKKIYISFDIDAYDLPYVPCTGTPEPFGLDPFQVLKMIKAIHPTAELIGMDMVEVGLRNNDYREGTLATETILRILARKYANNNDDDDDE